jgi:hypothetical protein
MPKEVRNWLEPAGAIRSTELHNSQPDAMPLSRICLESWSGCQVILSAMSSGGRFQPLYQRPELYRSADPLANTLEHVLHRVDMVAVAHEAGSWSSKSFRGVKLTTRKARCLLGSGIEHLLTGRPGVDKSSLKPNSALADPHIFEQPKQSEMLNRETTRVPLKDRRGKISRLSARNKRRRPKALDLSVHQMTNSLIIVWRR